MVCSIFGMWQFTHSLPALPALWCVCCFDRGRARAVGRIGSVALQAHHAGGLARRSALLSVPWTSWQLKQVTPCGIHFAGHEIVALHAILVRRAVGKMSERGLAQLVFFELPEVLADSGPRRSPPANRSIAPRSDSVAAGLASGTGCRRRWRARSPGALGFTMLARDGFAACSRAGPVAFFAAHVPLGHLSWSGCCSSLNGSRRRAGRWAACMLSAG